MDVPRWTVSALGDTRRRVISFAASFAVALTVVAVHADRRRRQADRVS